MVNPIHESGSSVVYRNLKVDDRLKAFQPSSSIEGSETRRKVAACLMRSFIFRSCVSINESRLDLSLGRLFDLLEKSLGLIQEFLKEDQSLNKYKLTAKDINAVAGNLSSSLKLIKRRISQVKDLTLSQIESDADKIKKVFKSIAYTGAGPVKTLFETILLLVL